MLETQRSVGVSAAHTDSMLRRLFPADEIYVVSDDEWLGRAGTLYGFQSVPLAEAARLPRGANVVLFLRHSLVSTEIRQLFKSARVLFVPIASFDPGLETALYTQRLTMLTDFAAARDLSAYFVDALTVEDGPLIFSDSPDGPADTGRIQLTCSLSSELERRRVAQASNRAR